MPMKSSRRNPIRAARERLGWTQAQIATEMGLARNSVTRKELGLQPITERDLRQLRQILAAHQGQDDCPGRSDPGRNRPTGARRRERCHSTSTPPP